MLSSCSSPFHFNQFSKSKTLAGKSSLPPRNLRFSRRLSTTFATASACAAAPRETAPPSLYDVLGVAISASSDEIKVAYRRLARSCHPDVSASSIAAAGGGESESAGDEFIRVHAAYSTLSDPEKRANYDRALSRRIALPSTARPFPGLSVTPDSSSFCRVPRRNWETDQCW